MPVQYVLSCSKVAGHFKWLVAIPSEKEANKKGGEKTMGGKIGRKKKEKKRKTKRKKKRKKKRRSQQNKRKEREKEGRGGGGGGGRR